MNHGFESFSDARHQFSGESFYSFPNKKEVQSFNPIGFKDGFPGIQTINMRSVYSHEKGWDTMTKMLTTSFPVIANPLGAIGSNGAILHPEGYIFVSSFGLSGNTQFLVFDLNLNRWDSIRIGSGAFVSNILIGGAYSPFDDKIYCATRTTNFIWRVDVKSKTAEQIFIKPNYQFINPGCVSLTAHPNGRLYSGIQGGRLLVVDPRVGTAEVFFRTDLNIISGNISGAPIVSMVNGDLYYAPGIGSTNFFRVDPDNLRPRVIGNSSFATADVAYITGGQSSEGEIYFIPTQDSQLTKIETANGSDRLTRTTSLYADNTYKFASCVRLPGNILFSPPWFNSQSNGFHGLWINMNEENIDACWTKDSTWSRGGFYSSVAYEDYIIGVGNGANAFARHNLGTIPKNWQFNQHVNRAL